MRTGTPGKHITSTGADFQTTFHRVEREREIQGERGTKRERDRERDREREREKLQYREDEAPSMSECAPSGGPQQLAIEEILPRSGRIPRRRRSAQSQSQNANERGQRCFLVAQPNPAKRHTFRLEAVITQAHTHTHLSHI